MLRASRFILAICAVAAIAGCERARIAAKALADSAGKAARASSASEGGHDPCTLVTQAEAEKYLGALAFPPFRADDPGDPSVDGRKCKYLAADGRYIYIEPDWHNAAVGMAAIKMGSSLAGQVFTDDNGKTDTLEGAWDEARWLGAGSTFFAIKGDVMVATDVSSSRGGIAAAADLSSRALARAAHPLAFDGAKAVARAPRQRETGDACALLTKADIETVAGPVEGAPVPGGRGPDTSCLYHLRGKGGPAELTLDVSWRHGFEHFAGAKVVTATVMAQAPGMKQAHAKTGETTKAEAMGKPSSIADDPDAQKMMGVLQSLAQTQGIQMDKSGGLVHDTLIAGPWAEGAILGGVSFVAVKNDVQVNMGFRSLSIEQAKGLMAKVMEKL